jgi:hypothetical protein
MKDQKIATLLGISLLTTPLLPLQSSPSSSSHAQEVTSPSSWRASVRKMKAQLASYIQPSQANYIDAPLPQTDAADAITGIYGNILYPQDREQAQQKRISDWIAANEKDASIPFPLSEEEISNISLYRFDRLIVKTYRHSFIEDVQIHLSKGSTLESAMAQASDEAMIRAERYREIATRIPQWAGRAEVLAVKLTECADRAKKILESDIKIIQKNPETALQTLLEQTTIEQIQAPYTWEMRTQVFNQLVEKVASLAPNSPYFLALQEVTPQALGDLKKTLAERNLQWISLNNKTRKATLAPGCEEILGEAGAFTSTIALSPGLEVLKVELGDLPTESNSERKILGVRVRNTHTGEITTIFTTHTDHEIRNDLYAKTAVKLHDFATRFFADAPESAERYVLGGDLNAFEQLGGADYIEKLRTLFAGSQDFRETDYFAPQPIAWSSFIGRPGDAFAASIAEDGTLAPNALDHLIAGSSIKLQQASRQAAVYDESGQLLDYYQDRERYMESLKKRITLSDHFFNIVRFK